MGLIAQKTPADTLTTYSIGEATVSGTRHPGDDLIPSQRMDGQQLERLSAHSVADALRYFSGMQIKDYGGIGGLKTVNIRSLGTNHVGIFYDGIELGNAQNGQVDLGRFSLENMESVSVYNGQRNAIFQPAKDYGSAGTVYLRSRTPRFSPSERRHFRATLRAGSFATVNPALLWEEKLNERLALSLSTEWTYTTGRYRFRYRTAGGYDTTATRHNGDINAFRAEAGLYGRMDNGEWRAKAYAYHSERGLPGAIVRNRLSHEDRQWDTNVFFQGSYRRRLTRRYSLLLNGKYAYDYLHYLADPARDPSLMYVDNHYRQQELYASAAHLFTVSPHWSLSLSTDYQWNTLRADLYNFPYPTRQTALAALATSMNYERFKLQASLLGTFVFDRVRTDTIAMTDKAEITPALFVSAHPFARLDFDLRAFYKSIFRMPTLNDLYYTFIGNVKLRPEYTDQFNVGFTYGHSPRHGWLRRVEVQADTYYNKVKDKIIAVPTSNQFRWTMMNLGTVDIVGLDVATNARFVLPGDLGLDLRATYTYQKAQDHTDKSDPYYGDQIPYVPVHSASLVVQADWRKWEANYSFLYTGDRYDQRANIPENFAPAWYTSDLSLARRFTLGRTDCRLAAEVNNLFNQQFDVVKGYPMPGINYKLIFTVQL